MNIRLKKFVDIDVRVVNVHVPKKPQFYQIQILNHISCDILFAFELAYPLLSISDKIEMFIFKWVASVR